MSDLAPTLSACSLEDPSSSSTSSAVDTLTAEGMPKIEHKASRTWEEMLADLDLALSGTATEIETVKEILAS